MGVTMARMSALGLTALAVHVDLAAPVNEAKFMQRISTENPNQESTITVTLQNVSGVSAEGAYTLTLLDGGEPRGDVTRPIVETTGFPVSLNSPSVSLGAAVNDQAAFDVTVSVGGRPGPTGLAAAGTGITSAAATDSAWWRPAPTAKRCVCRSTAGQGPDATPDEICDVNRDGFYVVS